MYKKLLILIPAISVIFWNLENFFDYTDGGHSTSDREFSSRGTRHWTKKKFLHKSEAVGKTILWADAPAVVGVAEVENSRVMRALTGSETLRKIGYRYVHFESPDPRGIDVALMYRPDLMKLTLCYPLPVVQKDSGGTRRLHTRDILYVELEEIGSGTHWHFFVNHHPSKYGGKASQGRRIAAMNTLLCSMDSLLCAGQDHIVAMGDFNDGPWSEAFELIEYASSRRLLVNKGREVLSESGPETGTIRFRGKWELIDNFIVSDDVGSSMTIGASPFLLERDRTYPGLKPRRTYIGPRYNGGISDHLPILLTTE